MHYMVELVTSAWTASSIALATGGPPGSRGSPLSSRMHSDTHLSRKEKREWQLLLVWPHPLPLLPSSPIVAVVAAKSAEGTSCEVVFFDSTVQKFTKNRQAYEGSSKLRKWCKCARAFLKWRPCTNHNMVITSLWTNMYLPNKHIIIHHACARLPVSMVMSYRAGTHCFENSQEFEQRPHNQLVPARDSVKMAKSTCLTDDPLPTTLVRLQIAVSRKHCMAALRDGLWVSRQFSTIDLKESTH